MSDDARIDGLQEERGIDSVDGSGHTAAPVEPAGASAGVTTPGEVSVDADSSALHPGGADSGEKSPNGAATSPRPSRPGQLFEDVAPLEREPALRTPGPTTADGDLLAFLAPGLVHSLGNRVFAIRGNVQLIASGKSGTGRYTKAVLDACREAEHGVQVLRYLTEDRGTPTSRPEQVGPLLSRICHVASVPFRDRGLTLTAGHSSSQVPRRVVPAVFAHCVAGAFQALAEGLPAVFRGNVLADLTAQGADRVSVELTVRSTQAMLPFPLELERVQRRLVPRFREHGAEVEVAPPHRLRMTLPVAR